MASFRDQISKPATSQSPASNETNANAREQIVNVTSGAREKLDHAKATVTATVSKVAHPFSSQARQEADNKAAQTKAQVSERQASIRAIGQQQAEQQRMIQQQLHLPRLPQIVGLHQVLMVRYCEAKATRSSNRSKCSKGLLQSHVRTMCLQVFPLSFIYHLEKYCKLQNLFNCVSERAKMSECYCE